MIKWADIKRSKWLAFRLECCTYCDRPYRAHSVGDECSQDSDNTIDPCDPGEAWEDPRRAQ